MNRAVHASEMWGSDVHDFEAGDGGAALDSPPQLVRRPAQVASGAGHPATPSRKFGPQKVARMTASLSRAEAVTPRCPPATRITRLPAYPLEKNLFSRRIPQSHLTPAAAADDDHGSLFSPWRRLWWPAGRWVT